MVQTLYQFVVVKSELGTKVRLSIYPLIYILTLNKLCVVIKIMRRAERVPGLRIRGNVRSLVIWELLPR